MSSALHGDWSALRPERRNQPRLRFLPDPTDPPRSIVGGTADERAATAAQTVANLRSVAGRYPDDRGPGPAARGPPRGSAGVPRALGHTRRRRLAQPHQDGDAPDAGRADARVRHPARPGRRTRGCSSTRRRPARPRPRPWRCSAWSAPRTSAPPADRPGELAQPPQRLGRRWAGAPARAGSSSRTASAAARVRPARGGRRARRRRRPGSGAAGRRPAAPAGGRRACPARPTGSCHLAATPKSASSRCGRTPARSRRFDGFTSPCTSPWAWTAARASSSWPSSGASTPSGSGPRAASRSRTDPPSTSSMARSATSSSAAQPSGRQHVRVLDPVPLLADEPQQRLGVGAAQHLGGDVPAGAQVERPVHHAVPAAADLLEQHVASGDGRRTTGHSGANVVAPSASASGALHSNYRSAAARC